jgi:uncharacterized protein (DUF433 family)
MSIISTTTPMIVETSRGPCIAGRRITVYVILDHLQSGLDREFIKEHLFLSDEQLDTAIAYIEAHREAVERDYAEIRCRSDERREHYEQLYRERSRFDPNLPLDQRVALMRRDRRLPQRATSSNDDQQNPA